MPLEHVEVPGTPGSKQGPCTLVASRVVSWGKKKLRVSFSGTAAAASPSASVFFFGRKSDGKWGGLSVEDTFGVNFFRNSVHQHALFLGVCY